MPPQAKRRRTDATSAPAPESPVPYEDYDVEQIVRSLDVRHLSALLLDAAAMYPDLAETIKKYGVERLKVLDELRIRFAERVQDFDAHSGLAKHRLERGYYDPRDLSDWGRLTHADLVCDEVGGYLDDIVTGAQPHYSFGTKRNALEAMRIIFECMYVGVGEIPEYVRANAVDWGEKMLVVLSRCTPSQLHALALSEDGAFLDRFRELERLAHDRGLFETEVAKFVSTAEEALKDEGQT